MSTKIPWTDETWNPVVGCTKCSPGCLNCYAEKMAHRLAYMYKRRPDGKSRLKHYEFYKKQLGKFEKLKKYAKVYDYKKGTWNGEVFCDESALEIPLHWKKPRKIFVCSMGDLFHEEVPFEFIDKIFAVMALCPQHTFQILTKRIVTALEYYEQKPAGNIDIAIINGMEHFVGKGKKYSGKGFTKHFRNKNAIWPLLNVHLGVSISTQAELEKLEYLRQIPAAKKYVSLEPLLGSIDVFVQQKMERLASVVAGRPITHIDNPTPLPNLLIIGAESKGAHPGRECKVEWVRNLVKQADAAGVAVHVKQLHLWKVRLSTKDENCPLFKTLEEAQRIYPSWKTKRVLVKDVNQFPPDLRRRDEG